jgi:hypothetical protein
MLRQTTRAKDCLGATRLAIAFKPIELPGELILPVPRLYQLSASLQMLFALAITINARQNPVIDQARSAKGK